jgi:hypothetical protein
MVDFMKFIEIPASSSHQHTRFVDYYENLYQVNPILEQFADGTFHVFAIFLYSGVTRVSDV